MVAARETSFQELLEGSKQYQVPLYQRTYSWTEQQLARLWRDIENLVEDRLTNTSASHFVGSLVLAPSPSNGPAGVQEFLVVDGQQRLTTVSVLLCAIRDHRAETEDVEHRERINQQYLINKWKPERQRLKLVPTQADRDVYLACVDSSPHAGSETALGKAYSFFRSRLSAVDDVDDPLDIERIEDAIISGLALVSVTTQHGDNAHRIFESLNNTGLQLNQADLLRNYLFMRLPMRREAVYNSLWQPLQNSMSAKNLELLFWLDLVQRDPRVKQTDTYAAQQARIDRLKTEEEVENEVKRIGRLGSLLVRILDPKLETDPTIQIRLRRLIAWGTTTVFPLLLHLMDLRDRGAASAEQVASAMLYVESFFVRRVLIGRATANLNRIMLATVTEIDPSIPVDDAVRAYLSSGRKYYATDAELSAGIRTVPFYLNGRAPQRSLILRWLEEAHASREPVDTSSLSIEHVMPQTATSKWQAELQADLNLDEDVEQVYRSLLHTLGNLTLTGYNPQLSNSSFEFKKVRLGQSGLVMNQWIASRPTWSRHDILERADNLTKLVAVTWPGPVQTKDSEPATASNWSLMVEVLARVPAGRWTSYGDLAALIGSHPVAVGQRLAGTRAPNAHRVLRDAGTVSPEFRWLDPARTDDPRDVLRAEGLVLNGHGAAPQEMRLSALDLAALHVDEDSEEV